MMTEQQICELFISCRCLEAELAIINVCFKELVLADKAEYLNKYCLLERKIAVIDNLHQFLPDDEQFVIQKHLVEGILWSDISEMIYSDENCKLPYDKRSLQRIKARAIHRIYEFIHCSFGDNLDFLIDDNDVSSFCRSKRMR